MKFQRNLNFSLCLNYLVPFPPQNVGSRGACRPLSIVGKMQDWLGALTPGHSDLAHKGITVMEGRGGGRIRVWVIYWLTHPAVVAGCRRQDHGAEHWERGLIITVEGVSYSICTQVHVLSGTEGGHSKQAVSG